MKILLEVQDSKAADFMEEIKKFSYVKAEELSTPEIEMLKEIKEIKTAFQHAELIKKGTLKGRPIKDLLDEL